MERKLDLYRDWSFYINGWWIFFRLFLIQLDFTSYIVSNIMKISFYKLEVCIKIKNWWRFNQITTGILVSREWSESFFYLSKLYFFLKNWKNFFNFLAQNSRFRIIYLKLKIYFYDTFYTEFGLLYFGILVIFRYPTAGKTKKIFFEHNLSLIIASVPTVKVNLHESKTSEIRIFSRKVNEFIRATRFP